LSARQADLAALEARMSEPGFWDNPEAAQAVVNQLKAAKAIVDPMTSLLTRVDDLQTLHELATEEGSDEELAEVATEAAAIQKDLDALELKTLLSEPHDAGNCYFSIHAGAGGTESCDWAAMLLRQYVRYFERTGYKAAEVDRVDGEEAGVRSVTLHVTGPYAYGYLSCERGVHRLVRVSPFDSQGRRHTSFAAVDVLPELAEIEVDVDWANDVREDVFHSSGPGGQNVNKVASAIRLTHYETGIVVQCQNESSQHKNRAEARKMLMARIYQAEQAKRDAELAKMYGNKGEIAFGNHIRSYVLYPYQLVRDERTELKTAATDKVLDGDIQEFIDTYLRHRMGQ
jgi:peptide chain release factor 2